MNQKQQDQFQGALVFAVAIMVMVVFIMIMQHFDIRLSNLPTEQEARVEVLHTHPECADELEVRRESVTSITSSWPGFYYWRFVLACETANVQIVIQPPR